VIVRDDYRTENAVGVSQEVHRQRKNEGKRMKERKIARGECEG